MTKHKNDPTYSSCCRIPSRDQYARIVAYNCTIGNGDAHLKNFSVLYRHAEDQVELAPGYDIVSTMPYVPRDTMDDSKQFPDRARLVKFVRHVTGKSDKGARRSCSSKCGKA